MSDRRPWNEILADVEQLYTREVQIGVFQTGAGGQTVEGTDLTIADLATIHEFGTRDGHVPARSFLRATMVHQEELLQSMASKVARGITSGKISVDQGLGLIGTKMAAEVRTTIRERKTLGPRRQENAPETIRRKGSSTPLVDSSQLVNAVTWALTGQQSQGPAATPPTDVDSGTASDTAGAGDGGGADS